MYGNFQAFLQKEIQQIKDAGLYKNERVLVSPQSAKIKINTGQEVLNFCANNYLGLSNNQHLIAAAKKALDSHGYGMSSVRFICGTTDLHKELEKKIADFFGTEDTILYAACFDANGGVFEPLMGEEDAIISDSLNHASIIDGVRLSKAVRYRYNNADMNDLEKQLQAAQAQRFRLIVTDGVFSMDGNVAPMDKIIALAEKYNALVMVDESHSAGVVGNTGRGVTELYNCRGKVDIITGTLGKAFGGAVGGFTTGRKEIIEMLRQRSRPYLFSNSLPPMVVAAGIEMVNMMASTNTLQDKLHANVTYFMEKIQKAGFDIKPTQSAIVAVMLYDAKLSQQFAAELLNEGIYVIGFYYPVVPQGLARIRVQLSAAHESEHIEACVDAFTRVGKKLGVLK
ncbi:MAG TPA: glycine C-acetyltransferase [Bacteroidales bacterium]|nr:glycine C-acetyltransferase [Bacteroidales bacterium]